MWVREPHFDAIDWAGWQTKVAAGAQFRDDGMHALACPDNGIDGAGLDAFGAADAGVFQNKGDARRLWCAVRRVQWLGLAAQQFGQCANGVVTAGGALIDVRVATCDGFGIGAAARELALRALCLRQQGVDAIRHGIAFDAKSSR